MNRFGLDGSIGTPKPADYTLKTPKGTGPFGRMGIDGTFGVFTHDYSGKVAAETTIEGGVQAQNATVSGNVDRFGDNIVDGGVQAQSPILAGQVLADKIVSGGVSAQSATVAGALPTYPLTGWTLTNFTVDYVGLSVDSPFSGNPVYSALAIGDKCHFETLTSPDSHTMTMSGDGEFTISPAGLAGDQTFDFQIYDLSDGTFGATATITVQPGIGNQVLGNVQAQSATVTGLVERAIKSSGGVQAGSPTLSGVLDKNNDRIVFGGVQADSSTVSGTLERVIKIPGIGVQAQNATTSGTIGKIVKISNGVQAQSASVTGDLSPPVEKPGSFDSRELKPKFINRKIKRKSTQRRIK